MIHSVAPVQNQEGWGNVMYIPAAPWCPRNEHYAANVRDAFRTGSSPSDFPTEHYERTWTNKGKSLSSVTNYIPAGTSENLQSAFLFGVAFGF